MRKCERPLGQLGAAPCQPLRTFRGGGRGRHRSDIGPAGEQRILHRPIGRPQHPIGAAPLDRKPEMLEALHRACARRRSERRAEALVGPLIQLERGQNIAVERIGRLDRDAAVAGERRIDRQPARSSLDHETFEPFERDQIEQRRRGDEIERRCERELEIPHEIDRPAEDGHVWRPSQCRSLCQKPEIVVDQSPILLRRKMRREGAQGRAGAAGEIDHRHRAERAERTDDRSDHVGIACGEIVRLAQRQPFGGKSAHATRSSASANKRACCGQEGKVAARAPAARRSR